MGRAGPWTLVALLTTPALAAAADGKPLDLPVVAVAPFVLLLLSIALLPVLAEHFWHKNRNKALVSAVFGVPIAAYLLYLGTAKDHDYLAALLHEVGQYGSFIILLASLYTVSGGIMVTGDIQGKPLTNATILAAGAVLANLIGTTGASMVLIRPMLRINQERKNVAHLPIFFIFLVSNLGGLLTPLGDPPLFLGFLRGVDFFWTLSLWRQWLVVNGIVLAIFFIWDTVAYNYEPGYAIARDIRQIEPLRFKGLINLVFLAGILVAVLLQAEKVAGPRFVLQKPWGEVLMVAMAVASLLFTPRGLRTANKFTWHPIIEVAVIFAGIFVTMVPALELLKVHGPGFGVTEPWQYFWLTGILSSFLDNAPTYLTFATMAAGPHEFDWLVQNKPLILQAISCGAVFMGANTYIGNGPNFMVKAISDAAGVKTPSFFGYMLYSWLILLPVFVLVTFLFFSP